MMTYKEYVKWRMSRLGKWARFLMFLSSNPPDWRKPYFEFVLLSILRAESLEDAHKLVNIALSGE